MLGGLFGGMAGIVITAWILFYPLPYWSDSRQFLNLPKSCIISDIGAECQVYCPTN